MYRIGKLRFLSIALSKTPATTICVLTGDDIPIRSQRGSVIVQVLNPSKWFMGSVLITQATGTVRGYYGEGDSGVGASCALYGNVFYTTL